MIDVMRTKCVVYFNHALSFFVLSKFRARMVGQAGVSRERLVIRKIISLLGYGIYQRLKEHPQTEAAKRHLKLETRKIITVIISRVKHIKAA